MNTSINTQGMFEKKNLGAKTTTIDLPHDFAVRPRQVPFSLLKMNLEKVSSSITPLALPRPFIN